MRDCVILIKVMRPTGDVCVCVCDGGVELGEVNAGDLQRLSDTRRDQPLIGIHNSLANEALT